MTALYLSKACSAFVFQSFLFLWVFSQVHTMSQELMLIPSCLNIYNKCPWETVEAQAKNGRTMEVSFSRKAEDVVDCIPSCTLLSTPWHEECPGPLGSKWTERSCPKGVAEGQHLVCLFYFTYLHVYICGVYACWNMCGHICRWV